MNHKVDRREPVRILISRQDVPTDVCDCLNGTNDVVNQSEGEVAESVNVSLCGAHGVGSWRISRPMRKAFTSKRVSCL